MAAKRARDEAHISNVLLQMDIDLQVKENKYPLWRYRVFHAIFCDLDIFILHCVRRLEIIYSEIDIGCLRNEELPERYFKAGKKCVKSH